MSQRNEDEIARRNQVNLRTPRQLAREEPQRHGLPPRCRRKSRRSDRRRSFRAGESRFHFRRLDPETLHDCWFVRPLARMRSVLINAGVGGFVADTAYAAAERRQNTLVAFGRYFISNVRLDPLLYCYLQRRADGLIL